MKWETKEHTLECPVEMTVGEGDDAKTVTVEKVILSTPKGKKMREIMRLASRVEDDPPT